MKKEILLIEDDKDITSVVTFVLSDAGYAVHAIDRIASASDLSIHHPEVILLDYRLANQDVVVLRNLIKQDHFLRAIPLILFSAMSNISQLAEELGADDYLPKPFDVNDLESMIAKWANKAESAFSFKKVKGCETVNHY